MYILFGPMEPGVLKKIDLFRLFEFFPKHACIPYSPNLKLMDISLRTFEFDLIIMGVMLEGKMNKTPSSAGQLRCFDDGIKILDLLDSGHYPLNRFQASKPKILFITGTPSEHARDKISRHPSCALILDNKPLLSEMFIAQEADFLLAKT